MTAFSAPLANQIQWTTDRELSTPAHFGDPNAEQNNLTNHAAWVDFSHAGAVLLSGEERITFLGGLVTNQVRHVSTTRSVYSAMLTPQGRFLWDFTMIDYLDQLLLLTEPDRVAELVQHISMYQLRAKVNITVASEQFALLGIIGPTAQQTLQKLFPSLNLDSTELGATFSPEKEVRLWLDPRQPGFGWRLLLPSQQLTSMRERLTTELPAAGFTAWQAYRIEQCLPRAGNELIPGKSLPLEAGLLELNGVDFGKGCYVGQETTARTHHRGTLKKRLYQVHYTVGTTVAKDTPVLRDGGKEVGTITSSSTETGTGLAMLNLQGNTQNQPLTAAGVAITVCKPIWATWT